MARKVKDVKEIDEAKETKETKETDEKVFDLKINVNQKHDGLDTNPMKKEVLASTKIAPMPELGQLTAEPAIPAPTPTSTPSITSSTTSSTTSTNFVAPSTCNTKICDMCG